MRNEHDCSGCRGNEVTSSSYVSFHCDANSSCSNTSKQSNSSCSNTSKDSSTSRSSRESSSCNKPRKDKHRDRHTKSSSSGDCKQSPIILTSLPDCAIPTTFDNESVADCHRRQYSCCCADKPNRNVDDCHTHYRSYNSQQGIVDSFRAILTPVMMLRAISTGETSVEFKIRRKNRVVTMQWQQFECSVSQSGVAYLSVQQTINQLPAYEVQIPIRILYKSVPKFGFVAIDPNGGIQIKFYLDISGSGTCVAAGDHILIPASCISWITVY